ncbi:MAG TPA: CsbD family protein [Candidatus Angelobacter sp.]|nr:CsbD family protein [Candidatus Angelobacter sp.]
MNWDQIEGRWKQLKGAVLAKWGQLTDSDLERIAGRREQLIGIIQQKYGIAKELAEKQVQEWALSLKTVAEQGSHSQGSHSEEKRKAG